MHMTFTHFPTYNTTFYFCIKDSIIHLIWQYMYFENKYISWNSWSCDILMYTGAVISHLLFVLLLHRPSLYIKLYYRLNTFLTASLYWSMASSLSPSFFNLVTESLYSCTSFRPSSCSRTSSPSPSPTTFMRTRTSKIFLWDGLSSQLYSSMSATVFSASQASVFWRMTKTERVCYLFEGRLQRNNIKLIYEHVFSTVG